jgi:cytochrome d ubiquinol oxidase subunit I
MVILGFLFILIFSMALYFLFNGTITQNRWFLWIALLSVPLPYIAAELGWIVTEVGRQPWIIQGLMPVSKAVSQISTGSVITTFILFGILFTVLLISEVSIMVKQIRTGPKH